MQNEVTNALIDLVTLDQTALLETLDIQAMKEWHTFCEGEFLDMTVSDDEEKAGLELVMLQDMILLRQYLDKGFDLDQNICKHLLERIKTSFIYIGKLLGADIKVMVIDLNNTEYLQ